MKRTKGIISLLVAIFLLYVSLILPVDSRAAQTTSSGRQELGEEGPQPHSEEVPLPEVPGLSEIIPLSGQLSGRLTILKKDVVNLLDVTVVTNNFLEIEQKLKIQYDEFEALKNSEDHNYYELVEFDVKIKQEFASFKEIGTPLSRAIDQLATWRKEWLEERTRWDNWHFLLLKEGRLDPLESTFMTVNSMIDTALNLINPQLERMLVLQEQAGDIHTKLNVLDAELKNLIKKTQKNIFLSESPPIFSPQYFSQRDSSLWSVIKTSLNEIVWPDGQFFFRVGWIIFIQVFITLLVIIIVFKQRRILEELKRLNFIAQRPFSAGLFLGCMMTVLIYSYVAPLFLWRLAMMIIVAISYVRLIGGLIETTWKKYFIYWLSLCLIANSLLGGLGIPPPLFRLYLFPAVLISLFLFLRWAGASGRAKDTGLYKWALHSGAAFFAFILIAEIWGKTLLVLPLFVSLIHSIAAIFVFMLLMHIMHGFLEWVLRISSFSKKVRLSEEDIGIVLHRTVQLMQVVIWGGVLLPAILVIWGVYDSLDGAMKGLASLGFNLGEFRISLGLFLIAVGILYGSVFVSWVLRELIVDDLLLSRRVESGVRHAIARLIHYFIVLIAFLLAISVLGFDVTKLTIIVSAFGIGIGFGLQSIVNNFVSGLILLFERPIRVGDNIELDGKWAEIKRIGLRATTVQTFDQADVIIPNADLISNPVTNWTLSSRQVRLLIPVGVAYGSDVPMVIERLTACADSNPMVVNTPPPQVLFLSFGESSLDFELRVWVQVDNRLKATSTLHQEIDRSFREAKIEIAFPQRDLHLRSVDAAISPIPTSPDDSIVDPKQ